MSTAFNVSRDEATGGFFEATASGRLLIRRCPVCSTYHPPQTKRCWDSDSLDWIEASGRAILVTWAVDHSTPLAPELAAPDGLTSIFAIVELDEGPWMQVPIVGVEPEALGEAIPMKVVFVRPGDGEAIPVFTPS